MRSGPIAALLSLALLLPACGDDGTATAGGGKETNDANAKPAAKPATAKPVSSPTAKRCARTLGDFLDSMESMVNTLAVGLDYQQYLGSVNRIRAIYADIPADHLGFVCLARVASPAEQALNLYIDAASEWGDCLATPSCETESIEAKLQRKWEAAADLLARSQRGLRELS